MTREKFIFRRDLKRYSVKKLRINGYSYLNGKSISCNKFKDIFAYYEQIFNRKPEYDFREFKKEEGIKLKKLVDNEKAKNVSGNDFIYVVGNKKNKVCKIGYSTNPPKRIKSIQTGCPFRLCFLLIIKGNRTTEKLLHKKYKKYKTNGEWFVFDGELKKSIESLAKTDKNLQLSF